MDSLHRPGPSWLGRVRVVLVHPSHGGNVGATARAMRVMGLRELWLVAPRFPGVAADPQALAFASGATDVLGASREVATLDEALDSVHHAIAISAATREIAAAPMTPEAACGELAARMSEGGSRAALVFGAERTGLSIDQVQRCGQVVSIPGEPDYHSLNLSQAVQVMCWELRRAALAPSPAPAPSDPDAGPPASLGQTERFLEHFEQALTAIEFLDPAAPKKLMPRMRRLFLRAGLRTEEVDLLRGVCKQMLLAAEGRLPGRLRRGGS